MPLATPQGSAPVWSLMGGSARNQLDQLAPCCIVLCSSLGGVNVLLKAPLLRCQVGHATAQAGRKKANIHQAQVTVINHRCGVRRQSECTKCRWPLSFTVWGCPKVGALYHPPSAETLVIYQVVRVDVIFINHVCDCASRTTHGLFENDSLEASKIYRSERSMSTPTSHTVVVGSPHPQHKQPRSVDMNRFRYRENTSQRQSLHHAERNGQYINYCPFAELI